jgi:hypothetical protein
MADANPFAQYVTPDAPIQQDGANPFGQYVLQDVGAPQPGTAGALALEQQNIRKGVVRGLQDIPEGGAQFITHAGTELSPAGSSAEDFFARLGPRYTCRLKGLGGKEPSFDVGRAAGNMIATAPVAYAMPGAAAESLWGRMLSGLASGAVSGAMQPVDNSGGDYWNQKGMQAGSGAVGGAIAPAVIGGAARVISPETNPNVKLLMKEGVTPTPGQIVGGWFNDLEEKFSSIPGVGDAIKSARRRASLDCSRENNMPILTNQRHEGVAQAYIADPERLGWRAYKSVYPNSSQHAAETGFSRLLLKNAEFAARVAELQQSAAAGAEITLQGLLREADGIQRAATEAKQYAAANGALKLKAELSGLYVQRKEDVTPKRSQEQIDRELRELLAGGYPAEGGRVVGGTAQPRSSGPSNREPDRVH